MPITRILKNEFGETEIPPYRVFPNTRYLPKVYPWMIVDNIGHSVALVSEELTAHKWAEQLEATGYIDVLGG